MISFKLKEKLFILIHSPILWLLYFALLFSFYFDWLCVSCMNNCVYTDLATAKEFFWRLIWGLFSISTILICTLSILFSLKSIHQSLMLLKISNDSLQAIYVVILSVLTGSLILFEKFKFGGIKVTQYLFDTGQANNLSVDMIIQLTMAFAFSAVYLIAISSSLMLCNPRKVSLNLLKQKLLQFRQSFYVTSIFLCIGIINVYCLWGWATHATTITGKDINAAQQTALGYTLSMSIIFSLAFIMLFVPVSLGLRNVLKDIAAKSIKVDDDEEYSKWRKEHGLMNLPSKHFFDGLVLISPMLVSALANFLGSIKY